MDGVCYPQNNNTIQFRDMAVRIQAWTEFDDVRKLDDHLILKNCTENIAKLHLKRSII